MHTENHSGQRPSVVNGADAMTALHEAIRSFNQKVRWISCPGCGDEYIALDGVCGKCRQRRMRSMPENRFSNSLKERVREARERADERRFQ